MLWVVNVVSSSLVQVLELNMQTRIRRFLDMSNSHNDKQGAMRPRGEGPVVPSGSRSRTDSERHIT